MRHDGPTVHLHCRDGRTPMCGANPWHYQLSPRWGDVTCWDCNRLIMEGSDNNYIDNNSARIREEWRNRK